MRISAALIAKDEEKNLGRCLQSLKSHVDEIVVVDTGSTDRTVEIAKEHGAKVGFFEWRDDFAAARNASLDLATGDWVLIVDADETLQPIDLHEVVRGGADAYTVLIQSVTPSGIETGRVLRLARRTPDLRFAGRVHENLQIDGRIDEVDVFLKHTGYQGDMSAKHARNQRLLAMDIEERPSEYYPAWQMAKSLLASGDPQGAIEYARRALQLAGEGMPSLQSYVALIRAQHKAGDAHGALKSCDEAIREGHGSAFIGYLRGLILEETNNRAEAERWAKEMLSQFKSAEALQKAIAAEMPYVI